MDDEEFQKKFDAPTNAQVRIATEQSCPRNWWQKKYEDIRCVFSQAARDERDARIKGGSGGCI